MQFELLVGDLAPNLPPAEYLRGSPVSGFEAGRIYVIECWASWCRPCVEGIPHLTSLQRAYPDITIVGFAVMEPDPATLRAFVAEKGNAMGYTVALDSTEEGESDGWMLRHWLTPAHVSGIPAAFIVNRDRRIAWIGHPDLLDEALSAVVAGSFDLQAAADRHRIDIVENLTRERNSLYRALRRCRNPDDVAAAVQAYDMAFAECPALERREGIGKLRRLLSQDAFAALGYARQLVVTFSNEDNELCREIATALADALEARTDFSEKSVIAQMIIDILQSDVEEELGGVSSWAAYDQAKTLAIAFLAQDRFKDADRQARIAIAHGAELQVHATVLNDLHALVERSARAPEVYSPEKPTVVCDGDSCRLVFAQP